MDERDDLKLTPGRVFMLMDISRAKFSNPIYVQKLCDLINIERTNPHLLKIRKFLVKLGIATEKVSFGNTKLLDINIKKLDALIETSETYQKVIEYIKSKNPFYNI